MHQEWSAEIAGYRSARVLCSRDQRRARQFDALRSYQDHSLRAMAAVTSTLAEYSFARTDNRGSRLSSNGRPALQHEPGYTPALQTSPVVRSTARLSVCLPTGSRQAGTRNHDPRRVTVHRSYILVT